MEWKNCHLFHNGEKYMSSPQFVIDIIKKEWVPGKKILEIGCGPAFLRQEFGKDYIGTDITDEPYNILPRDVDYVCPADKLPLKEESIDIVIIKSAFYLFNDHKAALAEAFRVLKSKGVLIIFDYTRKAQKGLQKKEGHFRYPCWTQWGLKQLIESQNFVNAELLLGQSVQPTGICKFLRCIQQELCGTWAIVKAVKG